MTDAAVFRYVGFLGLLMAGCSDEATACPCEQQPVTDAAAEAPSDAAAPDMRAFCEATIGRTPATLETCCTEADKATWSYRVNHGGGTAVAWECNDKLAASVARGRIALDPAKMQACEQEVGAAYDAAGCSILAAGFAWDASSCRAVVIGKQQAGEPCLYRYECADGLICQDYREAIDGTCNEPPEQGFCISAEMTGAPDDLMDALFGRHSACAPGYACLHSDAFGMCAPAASAGATCVATSDCEPGLRCHVGLCGAQGPSSSGGSCLISSDCAAGLYCVPPTQAGADGTCAPKKPAGGPCTGTPSDECAGYCGAGVCVAFCGSS